MSLKSIKFNTIGVRAAAVIVGAAVVLLTIFALVWCIANTASYVAEHKEVAVLTTELSPSDPQTHFMSGLLHERTFDPADLSTSLAEFEKAAALSPHNYLLWLRLGSARGRAGETATAEAAFRRALALAPNYPRVHWALGNFLLREGSDDEAYSELRKAIEGDPTFASPAVAIALQMAGGDVQTVQSRFQNLPHANASLAGLLAGQKRWDEAARVWNTVPVPAGDARISEAAQAMKRAFFEGRRFRYAAQVAAQQSPGESAPAIEKVTNPGFESPVKTEGAGEFDWRVAQTNNPQIGLTDAQKRSGRYGLIAIFNNSDPKDFRGFSQTVAVQPGRTYELTVPYRADLKSKAPFHWEIVNSADSKRLALSETMLPSSDWTTLSTTFTVPADTDGIEIRFVRGDCIGSACAATGSLWFDDISISAK